MGRTGASNHIIPITILDDDGKVVVHNYTYSLKIVKNRNNTIELRVSLGMREDGRQNQKSFYGHSEDEAKAKATSYLQETYGYTGKSITVTGYADINHLYKDSLSKVLLDALKYAPVYKRDEILRNWNQALEKFNPCFTCSVYLSHNDADGPLSCCCSKRYGMTF